MNTMIGLPWRRLRRRTARLFSCYCILGLVLATAFMLPRVASAQTEIGIDQSNLSTKNEQDRARTIAGIRAIGAEWFRDGYTSKASGGIADFVDEVRIAKQNHLKVLFNVLPVAEDYDSSTQPENAGPEFAKLCGWSSGSRKLSLIDIEKFSVRFRGQLDALKTARLTPDAFEIGNEFDWICFNGDVPDGHEASAAEFTTAVRAYAHFLRAAATLVHSPSYFPNAKIITFGLAHGNDRWDKPMHHFANPARMIAQLQNLDGFNYLDNPSYHVDGYGLHIYPSADSVSQFTSDLLRNDIATLGTSRPFWITEWGLDSKRFPNKTGETRAQGMANFYSALKGFKAATYGPVFYYAYAPPNGGSSLTDANGTLLPDARGVLLNQRGISAGQTR
jgi:hypothetical protein